MNAEGDEKATAPPAWDSLRFHRRRLTSSIQLEPGWALALFGAAALVGAVPFWVAGATGESLPSPFDALPVTALGFVVPAAAALFVSAFDGGVQALLHPLRRLRGTGLWWILALASFGLPTLLDGVLRGGDWPPVTPERLLALGVVYLLAAVGEELGWTTFALPRLLEATGSVSATAVISAAYWALWHLVPFVQTGQPAEWIAGQCVQTMLMRIVIVGLAAGSGDHGWLPVILHAASNLAWSSVPLGYRPWVVDMLALPVAIASVLLGHRAVRARGLWPQGRRRQNPGRPG